MFKKLGNLAPLTGVVFFALLLTNFLLNNGSPSPTSSGTDVLTFYTDHNHRMKAAGLILIWAVFIGVIFYGQLRDYLGQHASSHGLALTAFGGAIIFGLSGLLTAGTNFALAESGAHMSAGTAQALNLVSLDATYALLLIGVALLLFNYGLAILRSGLLPKWLGWITFPFALIALTPLGFFSFVMTAIWTLIVSVLLWRRSVVRG